MPGFDWTKYLDLDEETKLKSIIQKSSGNETTIQGFGVLTFNDVIAGRISISPYDENDFFKKQSRNK